METIYIIQKNMSYSHSDSSLIVFISKDKDNALKVFNDCKRIQDAINGCDDFNYTVEYVLQEYPIEYHVDILNIE